MNDLLSMRGGDVKQAASFLKPKAPAAPAPVSLDSLGQPTEAPKPDALSPEPAAPSPAEVLADITKEVANAEDHRTAAAIGAGEHPDITPTISLTSDTDGAAGETVTNGGEPITLEDATSFVTGALGITDFSLPADELVAMLRADRTIVSEDDEIFVRNMYAAAQATTQPHTESNTLSDAPDQNAGGSQPEATVQTDTPPIEVAGQTVQVGTDNDRQAATSDSSDGTQPPSKVAAPTGATVEMGIEANADAVPPVVTPKPGVEIEADNGTDESPDQTMREDLGMDRETPDLVVDPNEPGIEATLAEGGSSDDNAPLDVPTVPKFVRDADANTHSPVNASADFLTHHDEDSIPTFLRPATSSTAASNTPQPPLTERVRAGVDAYLREQYPDVAEYVDRRDEAVQTLERTLAPLSDYGRQNVMHTIDELYHLEQEAQADLGPRLRQANEQRVARLRQELADSYGVDVDAILQARRSLDSASPTLPRSITESHPTDTTPERQRGLLDAWNAALTAGDQAQADSIAHVLATDFNIQNPSQAIASGTGEQQGSRTPLNLPQQATLLREWHRLEGDTSPTAVADRERLAQTLRERAGIEDIAAAYAALPETPAPATPLSQEARDLVTSYHRDIQGYQPIPALQPAEGVELMSDDLLNQQIAELTRLNEPIRPEDGEDFLHVSTRRDHNSALRNSIVAELRLQGIDPNTALELYRTNGNISRENVVEAQTQQTNEKNQERAEELAQYRADMGARLQALGITDPDAVYAAIQSGEQPVAQMTLDRVVQSLNDPEFFGMVNAADIAPYIDPSHPRTADLLRRFNALASDTSPEAQINRHSIAVNLLRTAGRLEGSRLGDYEAVHAEAPAVLPNPDGPYRVNPDSTAAAVQGEPQRGIRERMERALIGRLENLTSSVERFRTEIEQRMNAVVITAESNRSIREKIATMADDLGIADRVEGTAQYLHDNKELAVGMGTRLLGSFLVTQLGTHVDMSTVHGMITSVDNAMTVLPVLRLVTQNDSLRYLRQMVVDSKPFKEAETKHPGAAKWLRAASLRAADTATAAAKFGTGWMGERGLEYMANGGMQDMHQQAQERRDRANAQMDTTLQNGSMRSNVFEPQIRDNHAAETHTQATAPSNPTDEFRMERGALPRDEQAGSTFKPGLLDQAKQTINTAKGTIGEAANTAREAGEGAVRSGQGWVDSAQKGNLGEDLNTIRKDWFGIDEKGGGFFERMGERGKDWIEGMKHWFTKPGDAPTPPAQPGAQAMNTADGSANQSSAATTQPSEYATKPPDLGSTSPQTHPTNAGGTTPSTTGAADRGTGAASPAFGDRVESPAAQPVVQPAGQAAPAAGQPAAPSTPPEAPVAPPPPAGGPAHEAPNAIEHSFRAGTGVQVHGSLSGDDGKLYYGNSEWRIVENGERMANKLMGTLGIHDQIVDDKMMRQQLDKAIDLWGQGKLDHNSDLGKLFDASNGNNVALQRDPSTIDAMKHLGIVHAPVETPPAVQPNTLPTTGTSNATAPNTQPQQPAPAAAPSAPAEPPAVRPELSGQANAEVKITYPENTQTIDVRFHDEPTSKWQELSNIPKASWEAANTIKYDLVVPNIPNTSYESVVGQLTQPLVKPFNLTPEATSYFNSHLADIFEKHGSHTLKPGDIINFDPAAREVVRRDMLSQIQSLENIMKKNIQSGKPYDFGLNVHFSLEDVIKMKKLILLFRNYWG